MKSIAAFVVFAGACLLRASCAHASGLQLTPPHPAAGQSFTIEFDYITTCLSGLDPPHSDAVASLEPANSLVGLLHVGVVSFNICFDILPPRSVHVSTVMTGLAAGTYPIYSEIDVVNTGDPVLSSASLQGNVVVGAVESSPVPALSIWGLLFLTCAMAIASARRRAIAQAIVGAGS